MTVEDLQLSWLHCNVCHRAFEGHNQLKQSGERIVLVQSDLFFYFTGCGHFFCENCISSELGQQRQINNNVIPDMKCRICGDRTQGFKLHSTIPEKVSMYLKQPISLLEDSLSIMIFQLNNANKLIGVLRAKISSQKDLLTRAKQDVGLVKELKERIKFLEEGGRRAFNPAHIVDPNETLRIPIEFQQQQPQRHRNRGEPIAEYSPFINGTPTINMRGSISSMAPPAAPLESPVIHTQGRLSLKSPRINSNFQLNSPFLGGQMQLNSTKQQPPRPVIKRRPYQ